VPSYISLGRQNANLTRIRNATRISAGLIGQFCGDFCLAT
jgi:hypothetical protein